MRIEKILVPIDSSPLSQAPLRYAMALSRRCGASLTLLHVAGSSKALTYSFPEEIVDIERSRVEEGRRLLKAVVSSVDQNTLDLRTIVKGGDAGDEIISTAFEERADLLVMGAHGHALPMIGSVAKKILEALELPVLMVGQHAPAPSFDRILFATDLSASSRRGLRSALELAQVTHSNVIALHAVDVGLEGGAEAAVYLGERRLEESRAKLRKFRGSLQQNFEIDAVLAEGSMARTIINTAEEKSANFIGIAIPRRGDASVAKAIISESPVPVLTIPTGKLGNEKSPAEIRAA
jgi:nucleotide-binding universal stress UspA family protein